MELGRADARGELGRLGRTRFAPELRPRPPGLAISGPSAALSQCGRLIRHDDRIVSASVQTRHRHGVTGRAALSAGRQT